MHNSTKSTLYLLALPLLFFAIVSFFLTARGPFYMARNYDPDYCYLYNSLNIALHLRPEHVDHPGTTTQLFGAGMIKLINLGRPDLETAINVLEKPEFYLGLLNKTIVFGYAISLFTVGWLVFKRTKSMAAALCLQCSPLFLQPNILTWTRFNSDPVMQIICLFLGAVLIITTIESTCSWLTVSLLSFLAATGFVSKIIFAPVLLIPLITLMSWKRKAVYAGSLCVFVLLWTIPIREHYARVGNWIIALLAHKNRYGTGQLGLLPEVYFDNLLKLFLANGLLTVTIALSIFALGYSWKQRAEAQAAFRLARLLFAVVIAELLQFAIAGKNPENRYVVPAQALCCLNLFILVTWSQNRFSAQRTRIIIISAALALVGVAATTWVRLAHEVISIRNEESELAVHWEREKTNSTTILFYGAPSAEYGSWFGNSWSGAHYSNILSHVQLEQSTVLDDIWMGQIGVSPTINLKPNIDHQRILLLGDTLLRNQVLSHLPETGAGHRLMEQDGAELSEYQWTSTAALNTRSDKKQ